MAMSLRKAVSGGKRGVISRMMGHDPVFIRGAEEWGR
jgi:hypothetical protein